MIPIHSHWAKSPKYNLCLIHGYADSHACFASVLNSPIAAEANIFMVDLPGFGDAPLVKSGIETHIQELVQAIEANNAALPCIILGHSMGGTVATMVAEGMSVKPALLIAVDSTLSAGQYSIASDASTAEEFKQNLALKIKTRLPASPDIAHFATQIEISSAEALVYWAAEGLKIRAHDRVVKAFRELSCPKYYLIGRNSFEIADHQRLLDLFADVVIWLPDAGHWIMLDTPQAFWQRINELISNSLKNKVN